MNGHVCLSPYFRVRGRVLHVSAYALGCHSYDYDYGYASDRDGARPDCRGCISWLWTSFIFSFLAFSVTFRDHGYIFYHCVNVHGHGCAHGGAPILAHVSVSILDVLHVQRLNAILSLCTSCTPIQRKK